MKEKTKQYFERTVIHKDGKIEKIKVPREEVLKQIRKMLEEDKEMLSILEKL